MSESFLDKKYQHWQNQLLDLGKRNKMIQFRETKRATLKLLEPSFEEMFDRIVLQEEELSFQRPIDRNSDVRTYSVLALLESLSSPIEVNIGDIKADGTLVDRQKTLKQLRSKSKLALDEQGTNILYMVAGFVEWREKNVPDAPWIKSPLVLVPVSLMLESLNAPYVLKKYEDDVVVNPTLAYLFERDYGITLPSFDADEQSISDFMEEMEKLVDKRGWRIVREISLGLVSFLKISMYKDLEKNEQSIKENAIIRAFAGEKNEISVVPEEVCDFDHDSISSADNYQVVNADSSQQDAILLSQKGISFVMQGPPGTGKSQTITNIIAQGLADGKKILFVSEKMAALEVVHRRLTEVNLADFCLALHSYKANKKEVLVELGKNLELKRIKVKEEELAKLTELDVLKENLKKYVKDIHTEIMPLEMSLYEVYGAIVALANCIDLPLDIAEPEKMTKEQVNRYALMVSNFDKAKSALGEKWYKNPWQGTKVGNVTYELTERIKEVFARINYKLNGLEKDMECILRDGEAKSALRMCDLVLYEEVLNLCIILRDIPLEWLQKERRDECVAVATGMQGIYEPAEKHRTDLAEFVTEAFWNLNADIEIAKIQTEKEEIEKRIYNRYSSLTTMSTDLTRVHTGVNKNYELLNDMAKAAATLKEVCGFEVKADIEGLKKCICIAEILNQKPFALRGWFSCDAVKLIRESIEKYAVAVKQKNTVYAEIIDKYYAELLSCVSNDKITGIETIKEHVFYGAVRSSDKKQLVEMRELIKTQYTEVKELSAALREVHVVEFGKYGITVPGFAKDISEFIVLLDALRSDIKAPFAWTEDANKEKYERVLSECTEKTIELQKIQNAVQEKWDKSVFTIDSEGMLRRYKTEYTGFFKIFKKSYRQDAKTLQGYRKEIGKKVNDAEAVELLQQLHSYLEICQWFEENKASHCGLFGEKYNGEKTDWNVLKSDKEKFDAAFSIKNIGAKLPALLSLCGEKERAQAFMAMDYWTRIHEKLVSDSCKTIFEHYSIEEGIKQLEALSLMLASLAEDLEEMERFSKSNDNHKVEELCDIYERIKKYNLAANIVAEKQPDLVEKLGEYFIGENTDFSAVSKSLNCVESLCAILGNFPEKLCDILVGQSYEDIDFSYKQDVLENLIDETKSWIVVPEDEYVDAILNHMEETLFHIEELQSEFELLHRLTSKAINEDEIYSGLQGLQQIQSYEKMILDNAEKLQSAFGYYFDGKNTKWKEILELLQQVRNVCEKAAELELSDKQLKNLFEQKESIEARLDNIRRVNGLSEEITWVYSLFEETMHMPDWNVQQYNRKIKNCLENIDALDTWIDYRDCKKECSENDLGSFVCGAEDSMYEPGTLDKVFYKAFYLKWLAAMVPNIESVASFRARVQNNKVDRFRELDSHQLPVAQMRIREKLIAGMPDANNFNRASDEMSVLLHELGKKRKIMPLRKLFRTIPNLLLKLKPCLMMSPLSVSYFLEAETYKFDMVIFDEASQIFPQDAIGAIFRGAQVIIAGDSKQLPPTNFFAASTNNESDYDIDDENEDEVIYDSILEEATNSLPNRSLLWHYRSRNEDLISFSNQEIYQNRLTTFPSSVTKAADSGVEYVYVENGVYSDRCNIIEAKKCVELVRRHILKHPERSLGIIAFSEKQQSTIEDEIQKFRLENPMFEPFFDENKEEAFFVKNLENVQGDERDTILFSICYAKDAHGRMYMRFGPLGHQGGERRLNVAITRAKENVKLVGSILPSDIDLDKTKSEGVKMLRAYIEFAIHGNSTLKKHKNPNALYEKDEFVNGIAEVLTDHGYKVHQNIGNSDYTIDIAIEHPEYENCYVAGIECDGESYQMARTVRDREHLRTSVLEQMGWKMYRVWSTEWINNYEGEKSRLLTFVKDAIATYQMQERRQESKLPEKKESVATEEVLKKTSAQTIDMSNPYGFAYYKEANWYDAPNDRGSDDMSRAAAMIYHIVKTEQPIHMELLYRRMAGAYGNEKATKVIRESVDRTIVRKLSGEIKVVEGFAVLSDFREVTVRIHKGSFKRDVEDISKQEIAKAMLAVVSNSFGIERKQLIFETARIFGYDRTGNKIVTYMNAAIDFLVEKGKVRILDEKVQLVEE